MSINVPPTLEDVYNELEKEVITLNIKWNQFRELYATSDEIVGILQDTASGFFSLLQRVLLYDILLSVCRLTDNPKIGPHQTLSLKRLPSAVETVDVNLKSQIEIDVENLWNQALYARQYRDWRIAHSDYDVIFNLNPDQKLPGFTREQLEETLKQIRDLMNKVRAQIHGPHMGFEHGQLKGDANALIGFIRYAHECFDKERREA
jgi:hypothetical protein